MSSGLSARRSRDVCQASRVSIATLSPSGHWDPGGRGFRTVWSSCSQGVLLEQPEEKRKESATTFDSRM